MRSSRSSRPDRIKWLLAAGISLIVLVGGYIVYHRYFYHPNVDVSEYPVKGIDVSSHNGAIDWGVVKKSGKVEFVYVKSSEGATYSDARFSHNVERAQAVGLPVGAYHFFRKNRGGKAQAENFMNAVGKRHLDLPWVIDIEDWDNDDNVDDKVVSKHLLEMASILEEKGHPVMIYTNGDGYKKFYKPNFQGEPLWLCSFKRPASLNTDHVFQQYSHWGKIPGIKGDVDLNVFIGSRHQWEQWLRRYKQ